MYNLPDLPEWEDDDFSLFEELGDGTPPPEPTAVVVHAKVLYGHWRQIFRVVQAALPETADSTDRVPQVIAEIRDEIRQYIFDDLLETAAKLQSVSAIADERVLLLNQAAIIRRNAQRIWTELHAFDMFVPRR